MKNFINPAFGAVDVAWAAEHPAQSGAFLLDKNNCDQESRQNDLNDVKKSVHKKY